MKSCNYRRCSISCYKIKMMMMMNAVRVEMPAPDNIHCKITIFMVGRVPVSYSRAQARGLNGGGKRT